MVYVSISCVYVLVICILYIYIHIYICIYIHIYTYIYTHLYILNILIVHVSAYLVAMYVYMECNISLSHIVCTVSVSVLIKATFHPKRPSVGICAKCAALTAEALHRQTGQL